MVSVFAALEAAFRDAAAGETKHGDNTNVDEGFTLQHVQALSKRMPKLQQLDLGRLDIPAKYYAPLAQSLAAFQQLQELRLSSPGKSLALPFWSTLAQQCHHLSKLVLLSCGSDVTMGPDDIQLPPTLTSLVVKQRLAPAVFVPGSLSRLKQLKLLRSAKATDEHLEAALACCYDTLECLTVQSHHATGEGLMNCLPKCKVLHTLALFGWQWNMVHVAAALVSPTGPQLSSFELLGGCCFAAGQQPGGWQAICSKQRQLRKLRTNWIRTDVALEIVREHLPKLRCLMLHDQSPNGPIMDDLPPLNISNVAWRKFFETSTKMKVWAVDSHRDTGISDLKACFPDKPLPSLCLTSISIKIDGKAYECALKKSSASRLQFPPASVLRDVDLLQIYGGRHLDWDELCTLSSPVPADPLNESTTNSIALMPAFKTIGPPLTSFTAVITQSTFQKWTTNAHLLTLPFCQSLHLCIVVPTDDANAAVDDAEEQKNQEEEWHKWLKAVQQANALPSLHSIMMASSVSYGLKHPFQLTDEGAHIVATTWPLMTQLELLWTGDAAPIPLRQRLTTKGLKELAHLRRLGNLTLSGHSYLTTDDLEVMRKERADVWADDASDVAPQPLQVRLNAKLVMDM